MSTKTFDPPAFLSELSPKSKALWSEKVKSFFTEKDAAICPYFFNPLEVPPGKTTIGKDISWTAFPKKYMTKFSGDQLFSSVEEPGYKDLSGRSYNTTYFYKTNGSFIGAEDILFRDQDEYCEWKTFRKKDGTIEKIVFTCENPEYWTIMGNNDPHLLLQLYRQYAGRQVKKEDLIWQKDIWLQDNDGNMIAQKGKYNPFNKWNNRRGIIHLSQPANNLEAEIILGAQATVIRQRADGTIITDPNELILSSQYGNSERFSDPKIGSDVNTIARTAFSVSINNPVALYMHSIDHSAFEFPKGYEFSDFWQVQRGDQAKNMILRAEFSAPKGSKLNLEAVKVGGLPLKYGGQIAQYITMVIYGLACDLSKPKQKPSIGLTEDLLEIKKIQANIAPGFKLPFQSLVGVKVPATKTGARLIEQVLPKITSMSTAMDYHQRRVGKAKETGQFGLMSYELVEKDFFWLNLAFGRHFIKACPHVELSDLGEAFSQGMYKRSALLGDPTDPKSPGSSGNWKAGAKDKEADIFFICAAPDATSLQSGTNWLLAEIKKAGAKVLYQEKGQRLVDEAEHFGFKDGISQPELRGLVSSDPNPVFFAERKFSKGNDDDYQPEFSAPGDILIWPGQFIFGYNRQSRKSFRQPDVPDQMQIKSSIKNGSFLAYRRLNQDVAGFYQKTNEYAKMFAPFDRQYDDPDYLRSKIVGRFKDGRSLLFDSPVPSPLANHFAFSSPLTAMTLKDGQIIHQPAADPLAAKCPFFAHTRKVNPRDAATNFGVATDSLTFRILRRGISFGPPYDHQNPATPNNKAERGLLFLSYQTSLENQFEFLLNNWVNSPINPEDGKGYDLLVGQNSGNQRSAELIVGQTTQHLQFMDAYITPTGGEYFFVPSIELLHLISGSTMQGVANKR